MPGFGMCKKTPRKYSRLSRTGKHVIKHTNGRGKDYYYTRYKERWYQRNEYSNADRRSYDRELSERMAERIDILTHSAMFFVKLIGRLGITVEHELFRIVPDDVCVGSMWSYKHLRMMRKRAIVNTINKEYTWK